MCVTDGGKDREAVPQKVPIVLFISADLSGPREVNQYRKDLGCCVWQVLINYGAVVVLFFSTYTQNISSPIVYSH